MRTWWSAQTGNPGEWFQVDRGATKRVEAVQINFAEEAGTTHDRSPDVFHYRLLGSTDNRHWKLLLDRSKTGRDAPHDYEVLAASRQLRYIRIENVHSPNDADFSLYDLRVFGTAGGKPAPRVTSWTARRDPADTRHATIAWQPVPGADFYIVRVGTTPAALTQNFQVYDATTLDVRSLNAGQPYFATIDTVNENGVTSGATAVPVTEP